MSNANDISIYFADPGTLSQRGLNEHSNGLLRKDGLPNTMDFNQVDQNLWRRLPPKEIIYQGNL